MARRSVSGRFRCAQGSGSAAAHAADAAALSDPVLPPRVARGLPGRPSFPDTLTWFEIFGGDATVLEQWQALKVSRPAGAAHGQRRGGHKPGHAPAAPRCGGHAAHGAGPRHGGRRRATASPKAPAETQATAGSGRLSGSVLSVPGLELLHEVHEILHALLGKRVVNRGAHAAHRAMAFQAIEACSRRFFTNSFSSSSLGRRNVMFISERAFFSACGRQNGVRSSSA